MVAEGEPRVISPLRRLTPKARLPLTSTLNALSADDVRLLEQILSEPMEVVLDASFRRAASEAELMTPLPAQPARRRTPTVRNDDSGFDLLGAGARPPLTLAEERHLFLRLNYCRYRAMRIVKGFAGKRLTLTASRQLVRWRRAALDTRAEIVRANLPLVLAMAKRARINGVEFSELVSEGDLALLRSVDKFDCGRGFKFSTYACRAILKSFSRLAVQTARYRGMCPTEYEPALEKSDHLERVRVGVESDYVSELRSILRANLADLTDVEQRVLGARFALNEPIEEDAPRLRTLGEVGSIMRVTKERVRQIQNKAFDKLRGVLEDRMLPE